MALGDQPTGRERAFIEHPDALMDPVKAYVDAGYSAESASKNAYALRKKHEFAIVERARTRLEGLAVTPEWVKNEVTVLAKTTMSDFMEFKEDATGNQQLVLKNLNDLDPDKWRAAIKEVEFDTIMLGSGDGATLRSRVSKVILYDRQRAIMDLAKLLGMTDSKLLLQLTKPEERDEDVQAKLLKYANMDELKRIADIFEGISERLSSKANKMRDDRALEHDDGST
jgi:Terminase small subunit